MFYCMSQIHQINTCMFSSHVDVSLRNTDSDLCYYQFSMTSHFLILFQPTSHRHLLFHDSFQLYQPWTPHAPPPNIGVVAAAGFLFGGACTGRPADRRMLHAVRGHLVIPVMNSTCADFAVIFVWRGESARFSGRALRRVHPPNNRPPVHYQVKKWSLRGHRGGGGTLLVRHFSPFVCLSYLFPKKGGVHCSFAKIAPSSPPPHPRGGGGTISRGGGCSLSFPPETPTLSTSVHCWMVQWGWPTNHPLSLFVHQPALLASHFFREHWNRFLHFLPSPTILILNIV